MDPHDIDLFLFNPIRYYAAAGIEVVITLKVGSVTGPRIHSRMQEITKKVGRPKKISSGEWPATEICPYWKIIQSTLVERFAINEREELSAFIASKGKVNDKGIRRL